jgi:hypothetical protein
MARQNTALKKETAPVIRTSREGWLAELSKAYREKKPVTVIDDAKVGIAPNVDSLLQMGRKSKLSREEWVGVLVSLGMCGAGIAMVAAAILDPEPTSKLGLLVGGGAIVCLGGGFSAIRVLTKTRPPNVRLKKDGFEIDWD